MATCDLCGAACGAAKLTQLRQEYQADGIADLCPDCAKWADKLKSDMLLEIPSRMRESIAERKGHNHQESWCRRFVRSLKAK